MLQKYGKMRYFQMLQKDRKLAIFAELIIKLIGTIASFPRSNLYNSKMGKNVHWEYKGNTSERRF
jgi:hypothetical protein